MGTLFIIVIVFLVVMLAAVLLLVQRRQHGTVDERLSNLTGGENPDSAPNLQERVEEAVLKTKRGAGVSRDLARADLKLTAGEFYAAKVAATLAVAAGGGWFAVKLSGVHTLLILLGGALLAGVMGSFIPNLYVGFRARGRIKRFNNQLADTTAMLAAAIRSGSSFLQSMDLISHEAHAPVALELKRVVQEVGLGLSTTAALANLYRRVPSDDLDLMITAINIQHEVGGNLAQILESISFTIRERVRIKGEIQTLTAQGRISGYVITGLPIFLAVALTLLNPDYMHPIFTWGLPPNAWCCLPVTGGAMIIAGYFIIMKIVSIEV